STNRRLSNPIYWIRRHWPNGVKTPSLRWTRQSPPLKKNPCQKRTKKIGVLYPYGILSTTWARMNEQARTEMNRRNGETAKRRSVPGISFVISAPTLQRFNALTVAKR